LKNFGNSLNIYFVNKLYDLKKNIISIWIDESFVKPNRNKRIQAKKKGNLGDFLYYQYSENFWKDQREKAKVRYYKN
jgi:hypothetical protein